MYCILRTAKIKDRQQLTDAAEHNFRLRHQSNIMIEKTKDNKILFNSLNVDTTIRNDLNLKLTEFYKDLKIKEKSDNVLMMEFVASASPEFFIDKSKEQIDEWANSQLDYFKNEFGENLKLAVLHLDELTPHIHFMISTEMKSVKKYKNQSGECYKESYSLNAKRFNPEFLTNLQDSYAMHNKKFGLYRGIKGSKKKHKPVSEYYEELHLKKVELDSQLSSIDNLKKFQKAYPILKQTILDSYESIKDLFSILDGKELTDSELDIVSDIAKKVPQTPNKNPKKTT